MPDRDKVISHFQDAIVASDKENRWRFVRVDIIEDAIELLKGQEPVKPIIKTQELNGEIIKYYGCGICKTPLPKTFRFCQMCGRKVKWDE